HKVDYLIGDTAGRLQNKTNLMNELDKMKRVVEREIEGAPHEVWLVIDATTGQNGISQAQVFLDVAKVTGIVLTKMDGTAKGGIVFAIRDMLGLPVKYIGLGETLNDLRPFDLDAYLYGLCAGLIEENE
ncbi:MAG: signal recognition particle-docking protein FtsY, partial [Erysipelotrichaceae bacterium]